MAPDMSNAVAARVAEWLRETPPHDIHRPYVEQFSVLPLTSDMGGLYGLMPSGEIVEFLWDQPMEPKVVTKPHSVNVALFQGVRRYPELEPLLPERPDGADTCEMCDGTGRVGSELPEHLRDVVICYCGGAGWLPPGMQQMPRTSVNTEQAESAKHGSWQFWKR